MVSYQHQKEQDYERVSYLKKDNTKEELYFHQQKDKIKTGVS